jgi:hypothetical protein
MEPVMYSLLFEYSITEILALHTDRCRAAQAK